MPEVKDSIEVDVPVEKFFEVITDFENYPEFLPECKACSIEDDQGNTKIVNQTLMVMKKINLKLKMELDPPKNLSWSLIKGDMMKENSGYWKLEDLDGKRTKATYGLEVKLKGLIPSGIVNSLIKSGFPAMLNNFKQRAEKLYKD
ncbi:MAG: SRPBCC family protein [Deltaproteobacteria bacterium]|nr:SRPBCC family protein [Deltaproteobacteria bacterium]